MRLIDADALKNDLTRFYDNAVTAKQLIDEQPTVDAAPVVHGRWIEREIYESTPKMIDEWQSARCTKCKTYHTTPYMYYFTIYKYCPNCGARMDGGENDGE